MAPSPKTLELIAVMCESILVGAYGVLTALVFWLLITKRRTMPKMHKILFGASIVMFLISVAHLALVMVQNTAKFSSRNAQARIILSVFQVRLIPPHALGIFILKLAGLTFDLASFHEFRTFFTVAPAALIVANTCICTLLIAGKIWYTRYQLRAASGCSMYSSGGFTGTIALFIESGALYATCQILSLVLDHIKSDGIHILLDLEMPLIGILPTLIIVFVHFELIGTPAPNTGSIPSRVQFRDRDRLNLDTFTTSVTTKSAFEREIKCYNYPQHDAAIA
ncbi:hypothetical protein FPV67DRAFT_1476920 [Lyophyllum atratum]|nr:hypothetical protein FPV67DRAFT_1476920 [Lyophyllum atratum]